MGFKDFMKWPGLAKGKLPSVYTSDHYNIVGVFDAMDLLAHSTGNEFLINAGSGYDANGNLLLLQDREFVQIDFPADADYEGANRYAYLCVRKHPQMLVIDYVDDPLYNTPTPTKALVQVQFYLAVAVNTVADMYFPPIDDDGVYDGLVIAKVYENAAAAPDPSYKTYMAVGNGVALDVPGFRLQEAG